MLIFFSVVIRQRKMTLIKVKIAQVHFAVRNYFAVFISLV